MSQVNGNIDLQSDSIQVNPPVDSRILSHHDVSQNSGAETENMVPLKIGSTENVFQGAVSTEDTEDTENTVAMEERNLADALKVNDEIDPYIDNEVRQMNSEQDLLNLKIGDIDTDIFSIEDTKEREETEKKDDTKYTKERYGMV